MDNQEISQPSGRKAGRPRDPIIGPAQLEQIADWMAEGRTQTWMAEQIGVSRQAIGEAMKSRILPTLRSPTFRGPESVLNSLEHMFKVCWEQFRSEEAAERKITTKQGKLAKGEGEPGFPIEETINETYRPQQSEWLRLAFEIKKEIATLLRYRTDAKITVLNFSRSDEEFRVAGMTPSQTDQQVIDHLRKLVLERRNYERAMRDSSIGHEQLTDGRIIDADP